MHPQSTHHSNAKPTLGIRFRQDVTQDCKAYLEAHGILRDAVVECEDGITRCHMREDWVSRVAPNFNTLSLHAHAQNLTQEILWSLLMSPHAFEFENTEALASAVRVRENIVRAARKTAVAFQTEAAERPADCWRYDEAAGFVLQPGTCLIHALICATQAETTGKLYDFSCYRASEYVILLGLAQEAQMHHPALLTAMQKLNEVHAVRSAQFHQVYLHEYGSLEAPLPVHFFVPGDRLWFRNPHEASADVTGYEGSWVIYMGGGLFSNFWKRDQPFTLATKCVEIYHWRDGLRANPHGEASIDESIVEARVKETLSDPIKMDQVLGVMMRMRDGKGIYAEGGCLDASRECPQQIYVGDCELQLPVIA